MNKNKGAASEGLITILFFMLFITTIGILMGSFITGAGTANNKAVNDTFIESTNVYLKTNETLDNMRSKFIDEEGNARTGIEDIINTLFTGIGGIITVLFSIPTVFSDLISTVLQSLLGVQVSPQLINLAVFAFIAMAIITTVYMISRR